MDGMGESDVIYLLFIVELLGLLRTAFARVYTTKTRCNTATSEYRGFGDSVNHRLLRPMVSSCKR